MKIPASILYFILLSTALLFPQSNTWVKITGNQIGAWQWPALVYAPNTHEYVLTMGTQSLDGSNSMYSVQVYTHGLGKWINALPADSLYGRWADSTGYARSWGRVGLAVFNTYYWSFQGIMRYLRPNLGAYKTTRAYRQFARSTDNGKIYFYLNNTTFSYDPAVRRWDTIHVATDPNAGASDGFLKWGSLCYDPVNHEVLLFGGGGVDDITGTVGTWMFNPSTAVWTKLSGTQPPARANSAMAYDPGTQKIVLFGGDHMDGWFNDTWVYDCATRTWSKRNPAVRPSPRAGHALLYLPKSGKIVLLGGYCYPWNAWSLRSAFEMWRYDVASDAWALIKRFGPSDTWPNYVEGAPAMSGMIATDDGDTILALADSAATLYSFTPHTYRMACDPTVTDAAGTLQYGLTKDTVATRGDWTEPSWYSIGVSAPDTAATEAALRALPIGTWTQLSQPKVPSGDYRAWSTTILDTDRDQLLKWGGGHVAHCGTDVDHYSIRTNRWSIGYVPEWPMEYNGYDAPSPGPFTFNGRPFMPTHTVKAYVYDVNIRKMIYCGTHIYLYDPDSMDWVKSVIRHFPAGFSSGYGAGLISTPHGAFALSNTRAWLFSPDSLQWRLLPKTGTLPGYYADNSGLAYDSRRDRVIIVEGAWNTLAQVWSYDFATGTAARVFPADSLLATGNDHYRESAYLPTLDLIVFQITKPGGLLTYDCAANRWKVTAMSNIPPALDDRGGSLMYDVRRNLLWSNDHYLRTYVMRPDSNLTPTEKKPDSLLLANLCVQPNPFNPSAIILLPGRVSDHCGRNVSLRVYALDGRLIKDLSAQAAGVGKVEWRSEGLSSGVYLVRFMSAGRIWEKKAVLAR
jgi:hypothetical protein